MKTTSRPFAASLTGIAIAFSMFAGSRSCSAVLVYFDGSTSTDFLDGTNWTPMSVPGSNLTDLYSIDDGLSSTLNGGTTTINGLRVGSTAKEHQFGTTHFGKLTVTGATLQVIGSNAFDIGREREANPFGGDYNNNSVVDAADYTVWRDTLGSNTDLRADGDNNGIIEQADYDYWKAHFGNVVKGGQVYLVGASTLTANGSIVGEQTKAYLSIGPQALVDNRQWDTTVTPNQFGGAEDMRIGGYGPAYDDFGAEPGLAGDAVVDVQGTLNAKDIYLSEHGGKGEIRLLGGKVNLNGALHMDFCGNCQSDPTLLAQRVSKVTIVGSAGTFKVGLDPDPLVVDPMPPSRDLLAASPTAIFSFTADVGGVTPITVVDNPGETSGTAKIGGAQLILNLDAYLASSPLTLIDAPAGHLTGVFGSVVFLGSRVATVNYDAANGNVFLNNFHLGPGAGASSLASAAVPEPASFTMLVLGLFFLTFCAEAKRRRVGGRGYQWLRIRA